MENRIISSLFKMTSTWSALSSGVYRQENCSSWLNQETCSSLFLPIHVHYSYYSLPCSLTKFLSSNLIQMRRVHFDEIEWHTAQPGSTLLEAYLIWAFSTCYGLSTFTTPRARPPDDKLTIFSYSSLKISFDISCQLSPPGRQLAWHVKAYFLE